jgi:chorismate dehydratase
LKKSIKLALVSYLNTLPFLHGLNSEKEHPFEVILARPSDCATMFLKKECDIALIPLGALPFAEDYSLITNFCIGSDGTVRTVILTSNDELSSINTIFLDEDSRTSAQLVRILCQNLWKKKVNFVPGIPNDFLSLKKGEAILAIGDKVFQNEGKLKYSIDLGAEWKRLTNLPMVFAVFVSRENISSEDTAHLNRLLTYGIEHLHEIDLSNFSHIRDLNGYLKENISYTFDKQKWMAMKSYLEYFNYLETVRV